MNEEARDVISITVDVGGKDAHEATQKHILALRKLLHLNCSRSHTSAVKEFALLLRIDGSVHAWGKNCVDNAIIQRRNGCAMADIYLSHESWFGVGDRRIREQLGASVRSAVDLIVELAGREKIDIDADRLRRDVGVALAQFLA